MFRWPRLADLSIKSQIFLAMMIVMLLFSVGVGGYTYLNIKERIKENTSEYISATLDQALARLDISMLEMDKATQSISNHSDLQTILLKNNLGQYINNTELTSSRELIDTLSLQNDFIDFIEIYGNKGIVFPREGPVIQEILSLRQLNVINNSKGKLVWLGYRNGFALSEKPVIIGIRSIQFNYDSEQEGYLVVYVKPSFLNIILKKFPLSNDESISIVDSDGRILSSSNEQRIGELIDARLWEKSKALSAGSFSMSVGGSKVFINLQTLERTGWKMVYQLPEARLYQSFLPIQKIFLFASVIGIICSFILSILLASGVSNPVRKLVREMGKVQLDHMAITPILTSNKEMKELSINFQKMLLELKNLIQQVYMKEILKNQAEIKTLQAQINPHFLYNTLDTIHWMLVINDQDEISKLVSDLAKLMRYSISNESDFATLEMEIDHLQRYLTIQQARFYDKLQFKLEISDELMHLRIPKLILQPIVENAIFHGLEKINTNGDLLIHVFKENEIVNFQIVDNGIGISPEKLDFILNALEYPKERTDSGIGLYNVHHRIQLIYGLEYGLTLTSQLNKGTVATIRIPYESTDRGDLDE